MGKNEPFLDPLIEKGFRAGWVSRVPNVMTAVEREEAVARLSPYHHEAVIALGGNLDHFWLSEQVHGNKVVAVNGVSNGEVIKGADGLATNDPNAILGIYVADCGAIYIADPVKKAVALLHSGRVGTEKNILSEGIEVMKQEFQSTPSDLIVTLAPCIRPPAYEVNFAAIIKEQALEIGIKESNYLDCGICTTSDLSKYYSYRTEEGKTGRMLALIGV